MNTRPVGNSNINNKSLQSKPVAFGQGMTQVVVNRDLYFDRFEPKKLLDPFFLVKDQKTPSMTEYFMPFCRLAKISEKMPSGSGCKFSILTSIEEIFSLTNIVKAKINSKNCLYWVPDFLISEASGVVYEGGKSGYVEKSELAVGDLEATNTFKVTNEYLSRNIKSKAGDLVVAIGSDEKDLDMINPFKHIGVEAELKNFDKIKDLPLRSAFVVDEKTPLALRTKLEFLEKICNADGNVRLMLIEKKDLIDIPPVVRAVLVLQKEYAKYSACFRENLAKPFLRFLEENRLGYNVERLKDNTVEWKPAKFWVEKLDTNKEPFWKRLGHAMANNKIATVLVLSSVLVPAYFRADYVKEKKSRH